MGKKRRTHTCVLCGVKFAGWGNNAAPLANGICCDDCNWEKVIPARIGALGGEPPQAKSDKAPTKDEEGGSSVQGFACRTEKVEPPRAKSDNEDGGRRSFAVVQDDNAGGR